MITAHREPDRATGRKLMEKVIASLSSGVPKALTELVTLGRTLMQRAVDVLAHNDTLDGAESSMTQLAL